MCYFKYIHIYQIYLNIYMYTELIEKYLNVVQSFHFTGEKTRAKWATNKIPVENHNKNPFHVCKISNVAKTPHTCDLIGSLNQPCELARTFLPI